MQDKDDIHIIGKHELLTEKVRKMIPCGLTLHTTKKMQTSMNKK